MGGLLACGVTPVEAARSPSHIATAKPQEGFRGQCTAKDNHPWTDENYSDA